MVAHSDDGSEAVIPAHLDTLAIFSPDLGQSEATEQDQVIFYYSRRFDQNQRKRFQDGKTEDVEHGENQVKLRHIGLVQGMVSFAR